MRIGEYFQQKKKLKPSIIQTALKIQELTKQKLGSILIDLGAITHEDLQEYLSIYAPDTLAEEKTVYTTIPHELLKKYGAVILSESRDTFFVASVNPEIKKVLEEKFGKKVKLQKVDLNTFLKEFYELRKKEKDINTEDPNALLHTLLTEAVKENASDIHVELVREITAIRFRINGVLQIRYIFPRPVGEALIARIKGLSNMDIAEKRYPQDGAFRYEIFARMIDIRVSTMPGVLGEAAVLRILDKAKVIKTLESLGMFGLDIWKKAISSRDGVILVTGPTGSGKSTTLYTTLLHLDRIGRNIVTIEDPVEYQFPFIRQVQVNRVLGLDFATFLKHTLRQDPDVILVGEVRDEETARIMIQAAETGHLVFATLHAGNIPTAFSRLIDLGISGHDLKYTLRCISSQALIRTICPNCKGTGKYEGEICSFCFGEGYTDRTLVNEILAFTPELVDRFLQHDIPPYPTIIDNAIKIYQKGLTDLKELERVFGITEEDVIKRIKST